MTRRASRSRGKLWADDRTLIGASDARRASRSPSNTFAFSTSLLELGVRTHLQVIDPRERPFTRLRSSPATYFGFIDRGVIAEGYHADLVVFDADTVSRAVRSINASICRAAMISASMRKPSASST